MSQMDFYLTDDHSARRNTMYVSIAAGASVGALLEWLGGKFSFAFAACVIVAGIVEFGRAISYVEPGWRKEREIRALPVRRRLLFSALSAAVLLVISRLRVQQTIAFASERKLLAASSDPTDRKNIDEARSVLARAQVARVKIDPTTVQRSGRQFVQASTHDPAAWVAAIDFVAYKSFLNGTMGEIPDVARGKISSFTISFFYPSPAGYPEGPMRHFGSLPRDSAADIMQIGGKDPNAGSPYGFAFLEIAGGGVILDGMLYRNVVFRDMHIVYHGSPTKLINVYFVNCSFEMNVAPNTQDLASTILQPSPATTFSGM